MMTPTHCIRRCAATRSAIIPITEGPSPTLTAPCTKRRTIKRLTDCAHTKARWVRVSPTRASRTKGRRPKRSAQVPVQGASRNCARVLGMLPRHAWLSPASRDGQKGAASSWEASQLDEEGGVIEIDGFALDQSTDDVIDGDAPQAHLAAGRLLVQVTAKGPALSPSGMGAAERPFLNHDLGARDGTRHRKVAIGAGTEEGTIQVRALRLCQRGNPVGVQVHSVELIPASTQHVHAFFLLRGSGCGVLCCNDKGGHCFHPLLCVFNTLDVNQEGVNLNNFVKFGMLYGG